VRGIGLANAVELVGAEGSHEPDPELAERVANGLRERGVLVGTTGRAGNSLKVRPPLAFTAAEVPVLVTALDETLTSLGV
jgi:4-aminobutyrate aminotransferase-like enzyme